MPVKSPEYKSLYRDTKKKVRVYKRSDHREFVDSITREDFTKIENWMQYFGTGGRPTKENLKLAKEDVKNLPTYLQDFAQLRFDDKNEFRKIYQQIRYRWNDLEEHLLEKRWNDEFKWQKLTSSIFNRKSKGIRNIAAEWMENKDSLREYLKWLYKEQGGKCALSGQEMTFERYCENVVSVDRIDSSRGYVKGNIHLTTWWANKMKMDLTLDDFRRKVQILSKSFDEDG
jgi:hypothetical protein